MVFLITVKQITTNQGIQVFPIGNSNTLSEFIKGSLCATDRVVPFADMFGIDMRVAYPAKPIKGGTWSNHVKRKQFWLKSDILAELVHERWLEDLLILQHTDFSSTPTATSISSDHLKQQTFHR